MALTLSIPALADESQAVAGSGQTATVPVTIEAEAAHFSVTVPTSLPAAFDDNGDVITVPQEIVNNSTGPVKITNLEIVHEGEWTTVDFDHADLSRDKVGTKNVAVRTGMTNHAGDKENKWEKTIGQDEITFQQSNWDSISGGSSLSVSYDAYIPLQAESMNNVTVASLIFTIGWDSAE